MHGMNINLIMLRRIEMGEYECWDCDKKFHLDEPPYDGREICYECREEEKNG